MATTPQPPLCPDRSCQLRAHLPHRAHHRADTWYQDPDGIVRTHTTPVYSWWGTSSLLPLVAAVGEPGRAGAIARAVEADRRLLFGVADPEAAKRVAMCMLTELRPS